MKRRILLVVALVLVVLAGRLGAQTFTGQVMQLYNLIRTGGITPTVLRGTTVQIGVGGPAPTATQPFVFAGNQDSGLQLNLNNTSATANAFAAFKIQNGSSTAFLGTTNINGTGSGTNAVPAGAHRSWLDISDNTAGTGWDIGFQAPAGNTRFYTGGYTAANFRVWVEPTVLSLKNSECLGAETGTAGNDSTISRTAAATWGVGNGTCGNTSGTFQATAFQTMAALITSTAATTPTFGTNFVGGAGGPTTGAQNGWVTGKDSTGATIWIPVWK